MPPVGNRMDDGFKTLVVCSLKPNIAFWIKSVKPFGLDAGGKIDTTTMHNTRLRTFKGKQLVTATAMTMKVAYDPEVIVDLIDLMGVNQEWTIFYPEGGEETAWAILDKWEPDDNVEGTQPEATVTVEPTNQDNDEVEQTIDWTAA